MSPTTVEKRSAMTLGPTRSFCLLALALNAGLVTGTLASVPAMIERTIGVPTLDRWVYPFGDFSGRSTAAPTFTTLWANSTGTAFDDRDSEFLVGFDVSGTVTGPFALERYRIDLVELSAWLTVAAPTDEIVFDPTQDAVSTYLFPGSETQPADPARTPDLDAGRPVELYAVGYRNGFTPATYAENTPFAPTGTYNVRNAFAADFGGVGGALRDASNNVSGAIGGVVTPFEVLPLAVGQAFGPSGAALTAGASVPNLSKMVFSVSPNLLAVPGRGFDGYVRAALAGGPDTAGRLNLIVSSLHTATAFGQGPVLYPRFMTKEAPRGTPEAPLAIPARLRLRLKLCLADVAGAGQQAGADGELTADDVIFFIAGFVAGNAALADIAGPGQVVGPDGELTSDDLIVFVSSFVSGC
jgi:hypothetical protein